MFSALRDRMTYANVVATMALVFAMSGGALAASHYLITSTKQIKPSVVASLKGKAGAKGLQGPMGPAGPAGAAGAGTPGSQGPAGPAGPKGETGTPGTPGAPGKNGTNGKEGSPWTAGGTLPSGKTETGTWFGETTAADTEVAISFPIPLAAPLAFSEGKPEEPENQVHYINPSGKEVNILDVEVARPAACPGSVEKPEAAPGNLCVYTEFARTESESGSSELITIPGTSAKAGAGTPGVLMIVGLGKSQGSWAVTAK